MYDEHIDSDADEVKDWADVISAHHTGCDGEPGRSVNGIHHPGLRRQLPIYCTCERQLYGDAEQNWIRLHTGEPVGHGE